MHHGGNKMMSTFQDPAIMMMASQGLPYAGNPWGLDPSYGAAYSMPTLPPGLVMPLINPQTGAPPPPGFFGGAAMVNTYARPLQPKSKFTPPSAESATKRTPNRRKNGP